MEGDDSDPDGVRDYVDISGTELDATSWSQTAGQLTARSNATAFNLSFNDVPDVARLGSVDSYAQCLTGGGALAYARSDGSIAQVLGQNVPVDTPTDIDIVGTDLGLSDNVATGTLTATVRQVENMVNEPSEVSAEAYIELSVEAVFYDSSGNTIYQGPLLDLKIGHVKVTCTPAVPPTQTPTDDTSDITTAPSATDTPVVPTSPSITIPPTSPTSQSPSTTTAEPPTQTDTPPSPTVPTTTDEPPTHTDTPSDPSASVTDPSGTDTSPLTPTGQPPSSTDAGGGGGGWPLPTTGISTWGFLLSGLVTILGGVAMLAWAQRLGLTVAT